MNIKYIILSISIILISQLSFAQKLYIWCPQSQEIKTHQGFMSGQDVNLIVFDGRTIPANSRVECDAINIQEALSQYIKTIYPSCHINILSDSEYYKASKPGVVTIKVGINAYQAGFGTDISVGIGSVGGRFSYSIFPQGKWNGLVSYYVQIYDNRKEANKKLSKEIAEVTSKSNMWGYKTAKSCLYESYDKANVELISFIEDSLMD